MNARHSFFPVSEKLSGSQLILRERQRQINREGYSYEHDDTHTHGQMGMAAACYERIGDMLASRHNMGLAVIIPRPKFTEWPWSQSDWKPASEPRRNYEKAGALFMAEGERLMRLGGNVDKSVQCVMAAQGCAKKIDALAKGAK